MKRGEVAKIILGVIAVAGIVALGAIAPNVVQVIPWLAGRSRYNRKRYLSTVISRLQSRGLITLKKNPQGITCAVLTQKGKAELRKYQLNELTIPKPKRWDGKYRLVVFDIKEWKRGARNQIREWLEHLGFIRLQNSVWVYPYNCQEIVALLKSSLHLGGEVLYLTVDSIENDRWIKRAFGL